MGERDAGKKKEGDIGERERQRERKILLLQTQKNSWNLVVLHSIRLPL